MWSIYLWSPSCRANCSTAVRWCLAEKVFVSVREHIFLVLNIHFYVLWDFTVMHISYKIWSSTVFLTVKAFQNIQCDILVSHRSQAGMGAWTNDSSLTLDVMIWLTLYIWHILTSTIQVIPNMGSALQEELKQDCLLIKVGMPLIMNQYPQKLEIVWYPTVSYFSKEVKISTEDSLTAL